MNTDRPVPDPDHISAVNPIGFADFYDHHYLPEHRHPVNRALHIIGTWAGLAWLPLTLTSAMPWLALLFPVVHAAPGLVGHRLFERNAQVGDVRVLRKDFSPLWFIAANHLLTFGWLWRGRSRSRN
jgi:hypothetical protein